MQTELKHRYNSERAFARGVMAAGEGVGGGELKKLLLFLVICFVMAANPPKKCSAELFFNRVMNLGVHLCVFLGG